MLCSLVAQLEQNVSDDEPSAALLYTNGLDSPFVSASLHAKSMAVLVGLRTAFYINRLDILDFSPKAAA